MLNRMMGLSRLDIDVIEEVENDQTATDQALLVVLIVSLAITLGSLIGTGDLKSGLLFGVTWGLLRWALLALVVYWVGAKFLKTPETNSTWGEVARVTGFAQSPGLLMLFRFLPFLGDLISVFVVIWTFVATVVAVRQALDYRSTLRALVVVLIGGIVGAFSLVFLFTLVPRESVF